MKRYAMTAAALLSVGTSACVTTWELAEERRVEVADFSVDLPAGWVSHRGPNDVGLTHDGPLLQFISVNQFERGDDRLLVTIEREVDPGLPPAEMAELVVAEAVKSADPAEVEVLENRPATVAGRAGFRLHLLQTNARGLRFETVHYGVADGKRYWHLRYTAVGLHYFERDLPRFEELVASLSIASAPAP